MEDEIITPGIAQNTTRYQNTITQARARLDYAIASGVMLMPSQMVINTESAVGYNNNLQTADPAKGLKFGVNNSVNLGTKKAGAKKMTGKGVGDKTNPPNSEASNKTHQDATQAQGIGGGTQAQATGDTQVQATGATQAQTEATIEPHHVNKAIVAVGALALVGVIVWIP